MSSFKLAYLGYRQKWESDHIKNKAPDHMTVVTVPLGAGQDEMMSAAEDANIIIPWAIRFDVEMAQKCKNLKLIQALSAGTDYLPVTELAEMGIRVANNYGGNAVAVAEITIVLIVSAYRQLMRQWKQANIQGIYDQGFWERWEEYHELTGKQVGIVGFGQIGARVARRLAGWECDVVYYDIQDIDPHTEESTNVSRLELDDLLKTSDVVTLHVPLNKTTRGLISDREFDLMKPSSILINTCRGAVIDEAALIRSLDSEQIAGVGLDVTDQEPIESENSLLKRDNVVILPHLAGMSIEARLKALDNALYNAVQLAKGNEPRGIILPL